MNNIIDSSIIRHYNFYIKITPFILSIIFSILNIDNMFINAFNLFISVFYIGFLLSNLFVSNINELLVFSSIISLIVINYSTILLSYIPYRINSVSLNFIFITIIYLSSKYLQEKKYSNKYNIFDIFAQLLSIFTGTLILFPILNHEYYLGLDPYVNKPIINNILINNLNPVMLYNQDGNLFSGFFYTCLGINVYTNISIHIITKYGGIFIMSFICLLTILMINYKKNQWSLIVPFLYMTNSFVLNRFVMTIRENFSFIFLIFFIYITINQNKISNYKIIYAFTFNMILISHPLTLIYASLYYVLYIIYNKINIISGIKNIIYGIIINIPHLFIFINWFLWVIDAQLRVVFNLPLMIPAWATEITILSIWDREIIFTDFSNINLITFIFGLIYLLRNKKTMNNIYLVITSFSIISIILFILTNIGFLFNTSRLIIYIAYIISIMAGLFFNCLYDILFKNINIIFNKNRLIKVNKVNIPLFIILITFISIVIHYTPSIINYYKWSPYDASQVEGALWLNEQNLTDSLIIPSYAPGLGDIGLIYYAECKNTLLWNDIAIIDQLMRINEYKDIKNIINNKYEEIYFFFSKRWINYYESYYNSLLFKTLNTYGEKVYENKGTLIYKVKIL